MDRDALTLATGLLEALNRNRRQCAVHGMLCLKAVDLSFLWSIMQFRC